MALKKPSDFINGGNPKDTNVNEPFTEIKEEFNQYSWSRNKLDELKRQVDNVTSSLNYSLAETVDKNLNFLSQEYSDLLEKFNQKIITLKEEIDNKVDTLQSSNTDLLADIEILDKRQKKINSRNIDKITEEVLAEIKIILSGDFKSNIQRLEEKIDNVSNSYQTLNEGLLNEPPSTDNSDPLTPLDQNFVTQKDLADHYTNFLNRVQAQIATIGGGGAVRIDQLDDVEISTAKVNGKFLRYNSTKDKWEGADASGGGGISNIVEDTSPELGGNLNVNGKDIISPSNGNIVLAPNGTGRVIFKGVTGNGGNGAGRFVLNCEQNSHGITIQGPPHSASASYTLTLPNNIVNGQYLKTDGSGNLSWDTPAGGGGEVNQNAFSNIAVSGQSTVEADTKTDTLNLVAGSNMTITTNASGDSITFASTGGGGGSQNVFSTIAVSGQNNVVADSTTDTLTLVAGSNMTITTNSSGDSITFASSGGSSLTTEQVQDIVGAMFTGNTETNITATYQDSDGTIDLVASGGGGGGASLIRSSASAATSSMSNNSSRNITITTAKSYALQKIQTSAAAWVTLYTDTTSRSNDSGRSEATDPTPGSGVIAEVITTGATSQLISPFIIGGNMDSTPSTNTYLKVVNKSGSTQAITVTLYYVPLEV